MLNGWYASNPVFQGPWDSLTRSSRHSPGRGIVAKLMGNDAFGNACLGTHLVQVSAQLADQGCPAAATGQQSAIRGRCIERTEEAKTLDESAHKRVDGDHALGLQFSERHLNGPLIGAGCVEAIEGEVGRFADAHTRVAE